MLSFVQIIIAATTKLLSMVAPQSAEGAKMRSVVEIMISLNYVRWRIDLLRNRLI